MIQSWERQGVRKREKVRYGGIKKERDDSERDKKWGREKVRERKMWER